MKNEVRRVFQHDFLRHLRLEDGAVIIQLSDHRFRTSFPQNADEDMSVLQVRRHVDLIDRDERVLETQVARDDGAELALEQFVNAKEAMLHGKNIGEALWQTP